MKSINIDSEFIKILEEIKSENKSVAEWKETESSDMFQSKNYCGGFDGVENKFTFSYYDEDSKEYWFEVSLLEIEEILRGEIIEVQIRRPD